MHKKRRILPFVPAEDRITRLKQMASLATAVASSKAEFSNELIYMSNMAPRSSNRARLEEGCYGASEWVLPKEDKETTELCRTTPQRGQCPPILVVFDSREGFTLQAHANIKDMTFITEFAGDVDYLENNGIDDCDWMERRSKIVKSVRYGIDGESHVLLVACRDIACSESYIVTIMYTKFAGDVDYLENRENDDSDCMMTLLLTADPSQSLVICPD
ncbi:putative Histone-lysine N-methyltransferase ATXR5 [Dichanthelium oligosanthes]|uniref:Putative Histone-lysine N-methyltransferase ATXR5 n=1 Tax=Dichanthelium oligosanthes TaxID=888268 RepID=A0A1E5UU68_9POAL|nr:putative Histone-lysine N-methyltransferase ATXR5 [Dichanthelium oligosanthes]